MNCISEHKRGCKIANRVNINVVEDPDPDSGTVRYFGSESQPCCNYLQRTKVQPHLCSDTRALGAKRDQAWLAVVWSTPPVLPSGQLSDPCILCKFNSTSPLFLWSTAACGSPPAANCCTLLFLQSNRRTAATLYLVTTVAIAPRYFSFYVAIAVAEVDQSHLCARQEGQEPSTLQREQRILWSVSGLTQSHRSGETSVPKIRRTWRKGGV